MHNKSKLLYLINLIFFWGLFTAQVPFEYFELTTIEPPHLRMAKAPQAAPEMPSALLLDQDTKPAGDLTLSEPFAPPAGIYKRRNVFSQIEFKDANQDALAIRQDYSACKPWTQPNPSIEYTFHRSALIHLEMSAGVLQDIPADSSEMKVLSIHGKRTDGNPSAGIRLFQCANDRYVIQSLDSGTYQIEYETVTLPDAGKPKDAQFFRGKKIEYFPIEQPGIQKAIDGILHESKDLSAILKKKDALPELIEFFQNFTSEPLNISPSSYKPYSTEKAIITERKGLCRHRTFMLMLAARSVGYPVRIAANEIHAFIEIKADERWYPIELGGEANSLTVKPTSPTGTAQIYSNYSFSNDPQNATSNALSMASKHSESGHPGTTGSSSDVMRSTVQPPNAEQQYANTQTAKQTADEDLSLNAQESVEFPTNQENNYIFIPIQNIPERLLRDQEFEISGQMLDNRFRGLENVEFVFEVKHESRRAVFTTKTNERGEISVLVRLPADWPLGKTETSWIRK